jgi:hypothetical protein
MRLIDTQIPLSSIRWCILEEVAGREIAVGGWPVCGRVDNVKLDIDVSPSDSSASVGGVVCVLL